MICEYEYNTHDSTKSFGPFVCDVDDFKNFWRNMKSNVHYCFVKKQDGSVAVFEYDFEKLKYGWKTFGSMDDVKRYVYEHYPELFPRQMKLNF